jgi:hypothetical protein
MTRPSASQLQHIDNQQISSAPVFLYISIEQMHILLLVHLHMKKFITAILALLYLSTASGATVHMHYCMGELANWGVLMHNDEDTCSNCGMEKSAKNDNGCCKDEHKFIKNDNDQKAVESFISNLSAQAIDLPVSFPPLHNVAVVSICEIHPVSNAPPRSNSIAVYILNRTFLI